MQEKYWASKIPVVYALLFVLNLILYILFEILVLYTLPANPDSTVLEKLDPRYGQSQVLWTESTGKMTCHLVQLSDGTLELITARRHDFSLKRYRVVDSQPIPTPDEKDDATITVRFGIHNVTVTVRNVHYGVENDPQKQYDTYLIEPFYLSHVGGRGLPVKYLLIGALLEFLELAAYSFIKQNL